MDSRESQDHQMDSTPKTICNVVSEVVKQGYCCSCGACVTACPNGRLVLEENSYGEVQPCADTEIKNCPAGCQTCLSICPQSTHSSIDHEQLSERFLSDRTDNIEADPHMGIVDRTFVGATTDVQQRESAPSGGLATALLIKLMHREEIDAAIVLRSIDERPWFVSSIASTEEAITDSTGSVYHAVPMNETLSEILHGPERKYAIVALPCVVKAIRLLQERFPTAKRRIRYVLGLACGEARTRCYPDILTALLRCKQGRIRYRSTKEGRCTADQYLLMKDGKKTRKQRFVGLPGFLWIHGVASLPSCYYCDDIYAELADVSFMEAYMPEFVDDLRGTSLVVSRSTYLSNILREQFANGTWEGREYYRKSASSCLKAVVDRRRSRIPGRIMFQQTKGKLVPRRRLGLCRQHIPDSMDKTEQMRQAKRELAFLGRTREILKRYKQRVDSSNRLVARFFALRVCWLTFLASLRYRVFMKLDKVFRANGNGSAEDNTNVD